MFIILQGSTLYSKVFKNIHNIFSFCSKFLKQNLKNFRLRRYFIFQYVVKLRAAGGFFFPDKGYTFTKNDRKSAEISPHKKAPPPY